MFVKIANNIGRIPTFYLLLTILFIGFILRTASWFYVGPQLLGDHNDYSQLSIYIVQGNWNEYFSAGRFYQPVYVLLLTPTYLFNLPQEAYIFFLHHLLSISTIYIVYLTAKRIFGVYYGLISAFFISINVMIIYWFSWVYADISFHFFLALLGLTAMNLFKDKKPINYAFFFFSGCLCMLTRPEGLFVFFIAILTLIYIHLAQKLPIRKALFIIAGIIFFLSSLLVSTLVFHKKSQEVFFSQMNISLALYVSSKISTNSPEEQYQTYGIDRAEDWLKGRKQPDYVSDNYILSMHGLNFIKEHPFTWLKMYVSRFASNIFPSVFSPFWSIEHRIYNFSMAFILVIGSTMALFFRDSRRFLALTLVLMAFTLALSISLFQREIDYRVPLSMFILFAMVAPYGWFKFYTYLTERYAHN